MHKIQLAWFLLALLLLTGSCTDTEVSEDSHEKKHAEKLKWFTEARYGMFIHWGASCIYGGEISWSRNGNPPDAWHSGGSIDSVKYDNAFKLFNPVQYDPEQWVQIAQDAGMKYLVITTRHHDGFSMFDTRHSDFKISNRDGA